MTTKEKRQAMREFADHMGSDVSTLSIQFQLAQMVRELVDELNSTEALADGYGEWMRKTSKPVSFAVWRARFESLLALIQEIQP